MLGRGIPGSVGLLVDEVPHRRVTGLSLSEPGVGSPGGIPYPWNELANGGETPFRSATLGGAGWPAHRR